MSPSVFVLGGLGQIGRAVTDRFVAGGWQVTVGSRGAPTGPRLPGGVGHVALNRNEPEALRRALADRVDVLVDVVPMTAEHARQILGLADSVGSAIAVSTGSVYADAAGRYFDTAVDDESFPRYPVPIPESQQTVQTGDDTYSPNKAAMERTLLEDSSLPVTILRPWAVHGPWSRSPREWWVVKRVLDRRPFIPLARMGKSRFQTTSVANLSELVWLASVTPATRVLNAADPEALTVHEITDAILTAMGSDTEVLPFEGTADEVGATPWSVPYDVVADMRAAYDQLGYRAVTDYPAAVADTVRWLCDTVSAAGWRDQLPGLSAYDTDLFDYGAEDRWRQRSRV